jgi:DNA modification methylase
LNTNRKFIGIEKKPDYFEIGANRIKDLTQKQQSINK